MIDWNPNLSPVSDQAVTPLDLARINHQDVIADMLEDAGAKSAEEVYAEYGGGEVSYYSEDMLTYRYQPRFSSSFTSDSSVMSEPLDGSDQESSPYQNDEGGSSDDEDDDFLDGIAELFEGEGVEAPDCAARAEDEHMDHPSPELCQLSHEMTASEPQ